MKKLLFAMCCFAFIVGVAGLAAAAMLPTHCIVGADICDRHGIAAFMLLITTSVVGALGASGSFQDN